MALSVAQTLSSALEGKLGTMAALRCSDAMAFKLLPLLTCFVNVSEVSTFSGRGYKQGRPAIWPLVEVGVWKTLTTRRSMRPWRQFRGTLRMSGRRRPWVRRNQPHLCFCMCPLITPLCEQSGWRT